MAQRRHHYDLAFEYYLRQTRTPYLAVDEAKRALIPENARLRLDPTEEGSESRGRSLKSFDFVLYPSPNHHLLVDIKGRKVAAKSSPGIGRLESWVTQDDVSSLSAWESLFGSGSQGWFVFLYWCVTQPPDALFQQVFVFRERWYALRAIRMSDYIAHMQVRSPRWRTVHLTTVNFEKLSQPLSGISPHLSLTEHKG